ncbi:MAG: hypothetical protein AVDCRST_MAG96-957 [uncultured Segetibacter sp.]|uniref:Uncharacterized protein n=1 Tax=uncultured Segetibacter sp. TaxID=481133 RepID=A0A6J4RSS6_9BACT|nr:MAG: hypothetical protein AVDCRST_MAG96-957 [uncultured Segetibacter sp.]
MGYYICVKSLKATGETAAKNYKIGNVPEGVEKEEWRWKTEYICGKTVKQVKKN